MKTAVLTGFLIVCSAAAFAQTPAAAPQSPASRTITLTGCVGGGSNAQPITLANAMVVPGGEANAAASPSPVPGAVSAGTTQPPAAAGTPGAVGTSGTAGAAGTAGGVGTPTGGAAAGVGTPPVSGVAGATAGTAGGAPTYGAAGAGTSATAGSPAPPSGAVGTSGTIAGTAPAGSSTSSVSGYRLTGADMAGWVGRRVQIVGSVAPATPGVPASPAAGAPTTPSMPEFRVVSVQPVTGDCPKQ
jgi:pilus assembly protein FimV